MGIASFLPLFGRTAGLSMLLAPVQALVALFVPAQPAAASIRPGISSALTYRTPTLAHTMRGQAYARPTPERVPQPQVQRLKIVRQFEPGASRACAGRLVISGRMADVCAELERLAS